MATNPYLDILRLTEKDAKLILQDLAARASFGAAAAEEQRMYDRLPFHEEALLLCQVKSGDGKRPDAINAASQPFLVKCVDISEGGMGFLHGAYMHVGTPVVMTLIARPRKGFRSKGVVARCVHLKGHVHLIGVKFDEAMDEAEIELLKQSQ